MKNLQKGSQKNGTNDTLAGYIRLKNKLQAFLRKNTGWLISFISHKGKYWDNTAMKYIKIWKQIIDSAIDEGWIKHNTITALNVPISAQTEKRLKCLRYGLLLNNGILLPIGRSRLQGLKTRLLL